MKGRLVIFPFSFLVVLLLSLISHVESQPNIQAPQLLACNRMTVPFRPVNWVRFARPMETGDVITMEGIFPSKFGVSTFSLNLIQNMAFDHVSLHMRFDKNKLIFSSSETKWNPDGVSLPQTYVPGTRYQFHVQKLSNAWQINDGFTGRLLRTFKFRHPASRPINYFMALETKDNLAYGMQVTVSMKCIRPPAGPPNPPPPPPPPPPPRRTTAHPPHHGHSSSDSSDSSDDSHHHGGGGGGHHHSHSNQRSSSSNSDDDSEDCDD